MPRPVRELHAADLEGLGEDATDCDHRYRHDVDSAGKQKKIFIVS